MVGFGKESSSHWITAKKKKRNPQTVGKVARSCWTDRVRRMDRMDRICFVPTMVCCVALVMAEGVG